MGHWCRICRENVANERFSGKGHRKHICRRCKKLGKAEITRIDQSREIQDYIEQSHISPKNRLRLEILMESESDDVAKDAKLVFELASVHPYKKRRVQILRKKNPDLLVSLVTAGLLFCGMDYDFDFDFDH